MNKKNLMALFALAILALSLVPASQAAFTITMTKPANNSYTNHNYVEFQFKVVGDNETYSYSTYNGTTLINDSIPINNNTMWGFNMTPLPDAQHTFYLVVVNGSILKNNTEVVTTDTVAPVLSITAPTAAQSISVNDTSPTTSLTISVSDATAGLDKCTYDIYNTDVNGAPTAFATNVSIAACTATTSITPHGGNNIVKVWANDSAGNQQTSSQSFSYRAIAVGGVGGSGSGGGSGIVEQPVVGSYVGTTGTTQPATSQPADNRIWWALGIIVVLYLVFHKKKKKR